MANDAYKRLVDELVQTARRGVSAQRIRKHGHPVRTNEEDLALDTAERELKAVFLKLSDDERQTLAAAFEEERASAVHDVAAFIDWATSTQDMKIVWGSEAISGSPYNGIHGDFIGRLNGDEWSRYEKLD